MKILTILGTRPEIIRLSRVIDKLDCACDQVIVHTGQNFDTRLNDIFFEELAVRRPDHYLNARGTVGEQLGEIFAGCERVICDEKPDRFLVLGDTNSSLGAIIAKRLGIPVYHMEAGNRCYDDRVPEEVNRRIIDHCTDVHMPYTHNSRENLIREGVPGERIHVTGNPIYEVTEYYKSHIKRSRVLDDLALDKGKYFLVTMHRAENVDVHQRLLSLVEALGQLQAEYDVPVIVSTHPRTRQRMSDFGLSDDSDRIRYLEPFGFFDFVKLEQEALCVLSDSGTVQEECCIFGTPAVTVRDATERPETLECGSNILAGVEPDQVLLAVRVAIASGGNWTPPPEYLVKNVSSTVVKILLSYNRNLITQ